MSWPATSPSGAEIGTIAIAAGAPHPDLRPDWPLLRQALADRGVAASTQIWTDPAVPWADFDLVVANGAWDNIAQPARFLAWADDVNRVTPVVNHPSILRWNIDKRYLAELARAGVPTVPTFWLGPGEVPPDLGEGELVVKPCISGGGHETARYRLDDPEQAEAMPAHITRLHEIGLTVMVQPYVGSVDAHGEVGLVFLGGAYSHGIAKGALLSPGSGVRDELWRTERIARVEPTAPQRETAAAALATAEGLLGPTTYARVDVVTLDDGSPAVLELELLDPALFFEYHPDRVTRYVDVLCALLP